MRVTLQGISKSFGPLKIIDDISLTVEEGSFFTLLGPSGCGKTTLLKIIAGFHAPDGGEVFFGDRNITSVAPHRRETGMVFQNYALFPHLSVFDNIAYGLRVRRVPPAELKSRVAEVLRSVQLEGLEKRPPSQLSGGQQQRVALARALVISPQILLMDEPLSNLDAGLRVVMRDEIRRIQRRLGITTIYVTHDQEESMAVSDQIAILNGGRLEQLGTPAEIYFRPRSRFSAEFMGSSNTLEMEVEGYDEMASLIEARIGGERIVLRGRKPQGGQVTVSIRPEWIRIGRHVQTGGVNSFQGIVSGAAFLGSLVQYQVRCFGEQTITIHAHGAEEAVRKEGETIPFGFDPELPVVIEP
jgi:iron(III) transport system ATP-binding protein